jgi:hypothetical protein
MKPKSMNQNVTLELVLKLAQQLSTVDQIRLVKEAHRFADLFEIAASDWFI